MDISTREEIVTIDLKALPQGGRYEDRYGGYIEVFHTIAKVPRGKLVRVLNAPGSWLPLLWHLGCLTPDPVVNAFDHCLAVIAALRAGPFDRTACEVLCSFRPETADALWKCDMQWKPERVRFYGHQREFIVTTNGAYHRPEVLEYIHDLNNYVPEKRKVVLCPCAADKPYPSLLHQKILELLPDDYYLMNATGVLGLVPQDLWSKMPWYDSGIPNQWRLFEMARTYFYAHEHEHVVVFLDFYAYTMRRAFEVLGPARPRRVDYPITYEQVYDYEDLMSGTNLWKLEQCLTSIGKAS